MADVFERLKGNWVTDYTSFVVQRAKPGVDIIEDLTPSSAFMLHGAVGLAGEAGELLEAIYVNVFDRENIVEELGDLEFYSEMIVDELFLSSQYWNEPIAEGDADVASVQIAVYASKILDAIKKRAIYGKISEDLQTNVDLYLRVLHSYMAAIRQEFNISREEVLDYNRIKLLKRFGGEYSNEAAQKRADKCQES